ncbi:hypothetical protein B0H15DRAFT_950271 [Mycena belliarum]|uniref:Uncharacterized protein n=1 Tax=Mycena belliarum TaxID=1033014 RepID=A0AAD6U6Y3_9AGAR|nr:hypothetical protein B0H15DRAFT_950271 [Mycena belliae]
MQLWYFTVATQASGAHRLQVAAFDTRAHCYLGPLALLTHFPVRNASWREPPLRSPFRFRLRSPLRPPTPPPLRPPPQSPLPPSLPPSLPPLPPLLPRARSCNPAGALVPDTTWPVTVHGTYARHSSRSDHLAHTFFSSDPPRQDP